VLVTGDNSQGQCGTGWGPGAVAYAFVELGPNAKWHGMARTGQKERGGGGEATDQVGSAVRGCQWGFCTCLSPFCYVVCILACALL
jgi:hypothetical protein